MLTRPIVAAFQRHHRAAWAAPATLAVAVTLYLAWGAWASARRPAAWLYQDDAWWRSQLRPAHDLLAAVFLALWLLAALAYWLPRRRRLQDVGLILVAAMVVIGAVLGTASFVPCRGGQSRTAVVAWVLSLYVGSLEPRYESNVCPGTLPLALQLARIICLGATFTGALAAAAVLWRQPLWRLRARLVKDATILTGLDAMTAPLLRRLTSAGRPGSVVVIEPDRNHPLLEEARSTGAQIVVADPRSPHVLLPLLRGLRGPQLRRLYAMRPEAADNEAILAAAQQVLRHEPADPDHPPHLIARIDDPRHADVWRGEHVGESPRWFVDALSPQESTARTLVGHLARAGAGQVLLCGDSALALAVLLELARSTWEHQGMAEATVGEQAAGRPGGAGHRPFGRVLVLDRRAADLRREYLASCAPAMAAALPAVEARQAAWQDHLLSALDAVPPEQAARTAVLITEPPSDASLHEAGRVARLHPGTSVYVLVSDGAGVADAVFDRLRPFQRTLLVDGQVPEDSWTRIARHWHEMYRLAHPADGKKKLTRTPWQDLDEFIRQDNILQLRSVMSAVVRLGRRWAPARAVAPGSFVELSDDELRQVACAEHSRWYERRRRAGWRAGAQEEDDDGARVNSSVRPWADLPQGKRDQACAGVRFQIAQLEAVGFLPVLPEDGPGGARRFQRVGEVRAERLTMGRRWRSAAGDEFTASAGDWQVVDESGHERTVRDVEFRASHAPLGSGRWRRTGVVRAWRVDGTTVVRTIEGAAVAHPGDWIVQGPGGERWPVSDGQFALGYIPADQPAAPPSRQCPPPAPALPLQQDPLVDAQPDDPVPHGSGAGEGHPPAGRGVDAGLD